MERKRIPWIDVAKGIAMISVILGHFGAAKIDNIVYSYHLSVFFLLTGYSLNSDLSAENLKKDLKD